LVADNLSAVIWLGVLRHRIREGKPESVPFGPLSALPEQHRHHLSSTGPTMLKPDVGPVGHQGERLHRQHARDIDWIHAFRNHELNGLPMH
jgi:hypothetical protein